MEAILVAQVARDQVKIVHRIEFSAATRATTLARISVEIPCENCTRDGQIPPSSAYPLFIQVSQRLGRVVATSELTAENAVREVGHSKFVLNARVYIPLAPGDYQLAVAAKNPSTGEAGVVRTSMQVPSYESLGTKN